MTGSVSFFMTGLLVLLCIMGTLFHLIPLGTGGAPRVLPDTMLVLLAVWSVRRPQDMPLFLTAALLIFADFALSRPVGLWALLSLLIIEGLAVQREAMRDRPFLFEWFSFAVALTLALIVQSIILRLALVARPEGTLTLHLFATTVAAYPIIAGLLHYVLRVRSPKPVERSRRLGRVA